MVVPTSRATAIAALLRRCILEWGVPEAVRTDEGENYTSRHVLGVLGRQPSRVELKTLNAVGRGPGDLHSARRTPAWLTSAHAGVVAGDPPW